jgi:hypothetical protein
MHTMLTPLTGIGLVMVLVGGLRGGETTDGAAAFLALLVLAVATYPPADPRRGEPAAIVLASTAGLLALGLLVEEVRADMPMGQVMDDFSVLIGSALVTVGAVARMLGDREERHASAWGGAAGCPQPAPPISRR